MSDKDKSKVRVIEHFKIDSISAVPLSQARFGGRILHVIKGTVPRDPPDKEDEDEDERVPCVCCGKPLHPGDRCEICLADNPVQEKS